jgi:hypothetical protein
MFFFFTKYLLIHSNMLFMKYITIKKKEEGNKINIFIIYYLCILIYNINIDYDEALSILKTEQLTRVNT